MAGIFWADWDSSGNHCLQPLESPRGRFVFISSVSMAKYRRRHQNLWQTRWKPVPAPIHQGKAASVPSMSQFLQQQWGLWAPSCCLHSNPTSFPKKTPGFSWDLPSPGIKSLGGDPQIDKPRISWLFYISRGNDGINLGKVHLVKWKIEAGRVSSNTIICKLGKWVFMKHRRNSIHSGYQKKKIDKAEKRFVMWCVNRLRGKDVGMCSVKHQQKDQQWVVRQHKFKLKI